MPGCCTAVDISMDWVASEPAKDASICELGAEFPASRVACQKGCSLLSIAAV